MLNALNALRACLFVRRCFYFGRYSRCFHFSLNINSMDPVGEYLSPTQTPYTVSDTAVLKRSVVD